jgi:hypothetical protein
MRRERLHLLEHLRVRPGLQLRVRNEGGRRLRSVLADLQLRGELQLRRRLQVRVLMAIVQTASQHKPSKRVAVVDAVSSLMVL